MYFVVFLVIFVPCSVLSVLYVSDHKAWADKIFRRFQSCHTDYNKISNRGNFGKSGQGQFKELTALQKWKHERYYFLAPFYKQGQKTFKQSRTTSVLGGPPPSTDGDSDEAPDDERGHESSSSNTRKDTPEQFALSLTSPPPIRRTKKRTRDMDEKASTDQKAAHYGELMTVMKESASEAKNRELFFPGAAAAASNLPSPKASRSIRHNLHRPFALTAVPAVPAVPGGSDHTSSNGECIVLIVKSEPK